MATLRSTFQRRAGQVLIPLLALALVGAVLFRFVGTADAKQHYDVPHDGQMESDLGVRFSQAAVVGDGGLVELRYVVLDGQKASAFQNDTKHPPQLKSERTGATTIHDHVLGLKLIQGFQGLKQMLFHSH